MAEKKESSAVTVRIDAETRARWEGAAKDRGYTLSEFVRSCVDAETVAAVATEKKPVGRGRAKKEEPSPTAGNGLCEHRVPRTSYCSRCAR